MSFEEKNQQNGTAEERVKRRGTKEMKNGFDVAWKTFEKMGAPVNRLTNKIGSEAFWPQSLERESNKAARILNSFCHDGFYNSKTQPPRSDGPNQNPKVLVKIPPSVIQDCVGLAIFSTMRAGLHVSGATGSGVLIARLPDGSWSPPSGILVHTLGVGFNAGIDLYDCVIVINNHAALRAFSSLRVTLGAELSATLGPLGAGALLDTNVAPAALDPKGVPVPVDRSPCYTYMKSRGLYAGLQIDGTIIRARHDANERFYGERLPVSDILAAHLQNGVPQEVLPLMEVVRAVNGWANFAHGGVEREAPSAEEGEAGVVVMNGEEKEREWEMVVQSEKQREAAAHNGSYEATQ